MRRHIRALSIMLLGSALACAENRPDGSHPARKDAHKPAAHAVKDTAPQNTLHLQAAIAGLARGETSPRTPCRPDSAFRK